MKLYKENSIFYTPDGREVNLVFIPAKAPLSSLAKKLYYEHCQDPKKCLDIFMERVKHYIEMPFELANTFERRPTKQEKAGYIDRLTTITQIARNNYKSIIKQTLYPEGQIQEMYIPGKNLSRQDKEYNNIVFTSLLERSLTRMTNSDFMKALASDMELVDQVRKDSSRFPELEKLCSYALKRFMTSQRIRYIPEEDQYQEGLLAVWHAAEGYEARNFARFASLAKRSLDFKFNNLIKMYTAHKRRVNKFTSPMGSASDSGDSFLSRKFDGLTLEAWRRTERIQLSDQAVEDAPDYDPFCILPQVREYPPNPLKEMETVFSEPYSSQQINVVFESNFPHLNERVLTFVSKAELSNNRKTRATSDFIERMMKGECYTDENNTLRAKNPSPIMLEVEQELKNLQEDESWKKELKARADSLSKTYTPSDEIPF